MNTWIELIINEVGNKIIKVVIKSNPNNKSNGVPNNSTPTPKRDWITVEISIVEKIARDTRINPELLRHAITTFGLEQHIYDEASYQAFYPKNKNQLKFFFYSKTRKKKLLTLID